MKQFIPHIITKENVTVYIDGSPVIVPSMSPQYNQILNAIDDMDLDAVKSIISIKQSVVNNSNGKITLINSVLYFDNRPLHNALTKRIINIISEAGDASPLINFLNNLMMNPSKRAVDELYGFLEACELPITPDGYFLAYKKIRNDYKDIYTGTMDNSVGSKPTVPRNSVDENKDNTCSTGLHFCSKHYLSYYGTNDKTNRVVVVKIHPADVVAIPSDYNNAKGRASSYTVVEELSNEFGNTENDVIDIKSNYVNNAYNKHSRKLSDGEVMLIRNYLNENKSSVTELAKKFNVSTRTIGRIRDYESYADVV